MKCLKSYKTFQKPLLEVADIFRVNIHKMNKLSPDQWKAVTDIINCRTKKLGGHSSICNNCGHIDISYNSCRNRNCPKCQGLKKVKWLLDREKELLPINYFHVIFTIPHQLNKITFQNRKVVYNLMFDSAKETLLEASSNPKNLGAKIGFIGIMHTWGQTLSFHPHIHCIVTGGGITKDNKWKNSNSEYFLPVKILSILFKNKLISKIREEFKKQTLSFFNDLQILKDYNNFNKLLNDAYDKKWMIYSKPPFSNSKNVFEYISRYTHKIAISNHRILKLNSEYVTFKYKDYSDQGKNKLMTLTNIEFMRRFLMHIIPKRFMRIRFGGIFSNRYRKENIKKVRLLFNMNENYEKNTNNWKKIFYKLSGINIDKCSVCKKGTMIDIIENTS